MVDVDVVDVVVVVVVVIVVVDRESCINLE